MIRALYMLHTLSVEDLGYAKRDRRNNTHALPTTRQLWAGLLQLCYFMSVLCVILLTTLQRYT